jgi:8-oxo-dGTP pyrophosphatase MutT (NUDIX family)
MSAITRSCVNVIAISGRRGKMMRKPPHQPEEIDHYYSGVFLVAPGGRLIGQRRDDIPTIDNPGKVSTFGGTVEAGEDPLEAAWRELTQEETNLHLPDRAIRHLMDDVAWRELTSEWEVRHFFYASITDEQLEALEVFEGAGWAEITGPEDPDLIDSWRTPTQLVSERVGEGWA